MKPSIKIALDKIRPGMIVADNIFYKEDLLLAKGTVIKSNYIDYLRKKDINGISVIAEKTYYDMLFDNPAEKFYAETYEKVAYILENAKNNLPLSSSSIFSVVETILESVFSKKDSVLLLTGFSGKYDYLTAHSLDVCIYCSIIAKTLNLSYEKTVNLGLASLLHDIGKTKIDDKILSKKGVLTPAELEEVKKHPHLGSEIVKKIFGYTNNIFRIVLQHHERCDGSGYPMGLTRDKIYDLSKLLAIADIYDALTSDRPYHKKILPHEAAEYLLAISGSQIDAKLTDIFIRNIAIYPKGCQILLNTNQIATVTDSNKNMPLRPIIKIMTDCKGTPLLHHYEINLESNPSLIITQIFN
ncbi:MAG: HD-GYP domain-containing protein [Clostridiaceae bacterium]|jgi:HD-GYP domain-containing protein (c-di-GMP phosphodiesterase class II)|nr:HD-GYP domain-containing protein [Clostridiaceae bacterium]